MDKGAIVENVICGILVVAAIGLAIGFWLF